jgi:2-succinyl-6-hydroxy-2,4-cyclohexadiene-1-carboxylate synthase
VTRLDISGLGINVEIAGSGPPLVLLHGFTGSAAGWRPLTDLWPGFTTIAIDLVGHGQSDSPKDVERYRMQACVDEIAGALDALAIGRAAMLGYSMGGRTALHFALRHPERLTALILESGSAGYSDPRERAERVKSDEALAERIETEGLDAFVAYWQSLPLWASQAALSVERRRALREQRLRNSTTGLANSLRGMGAGAQEPVMERLGEIRVPTLFMAGSLDARYAELARDMSTRVARSEIEIIEDAGHAAHLEQPVAFSDAVRSFLERVPTTTTTAREA